LITTPQIVRTWLVGFTLALIAMITLGVNQSHARGYRHYGQQHARTHFAHRHFHRHYAINRAGRSNSYSYFAPQIGYQPNFFEQKLNQMAENVRRTTTMVASWYGGGEKLARHTASGEVFRPGGLTVAHRSLPMGTRVRISHAGHTAVCRVNDRGPAAWTGRSIDLARGCANAVGMHGIARVQVAVLGR
jgi:rare lipoprotein A